MIRDRQKWFLLQWRKHRGLTQQQLADRMGTTKSYVSEFENGKRRYNQDLLEGFAEALNCEPGDLLMRNPLDTAAPWTIWDTIPEADRKKALKVLKALSTESEEDGEMLVKPRKARK